MFNNLKLVNSYIYLSYFCLYLCLFFCKKYILIIAMAQPTGTRQGDKCLITSVFVKGLHDPEGRDCSSGLLCYMNCSFKEPNLVYDEF